MEVFGLVQMVGRIVMMERPSRTLDVKRVSNKNHEIHTRICFVPTVCFLQVLWTKPKPLAKDYIRPESIDSNNTQFRQHPDPAHHVVVHEFTYLVAMQYFCNKTVLQMRTYGEVNKKFSKELERELSKAKAELASVKFNGLKIESEYYEQFLKKINDQFRD
jgi:hypothetical protein